MSGRIQAACRRALVAVVLLVVFGPNQAHAAPLQLDGVILTSGGGPAPDGTYALSVSLYASQSAPVASWGVLLPTVQVSGGRFSVLAGVQSPPAAATVAAMPEVWVGISVDGEPELPRRRAGAAIEAITAQTANALSCTGCVTGAALDPALLSAVAWRDEPNAFTQENVFQKPVGFGEAPAQGCGVDVAADVTPCRAGAPVRWTRLVPDAASLQTLTDDGQLAYRTDNKQLYVRSGTSWRQVLLEPVCGDGVVGPGEACDDGNQVAGDGCEGCQLAAPDGMALIPAGTFWMGCNAALDGACQPEELPQHWVTLSAYAIDKTEVTVAAYVACVQAGGCTTNGLGDSCSKVSATYTNPAKINHPINCVTWEQADAYCKWAGKRLPTEAEWERAARGGCDTLPGNCGTSMRTYPWGEDLPTCAQAKTSNCGDWTTVAVGSTSPAGDSPYGLSEMIGNVHEWTADYDGPFDLAPATNPTGPSQGVNRILKGGSFTGANTSLGMRTAYRKPNKPWVQTAAFGFRCAKSL
jgi:cysteine-rich repeat protein